MKQDLLREIKWLAHSWGAWLKIAKGASIFQAFQLQAAKDKAALMLALAEYKVWRTHERMRSL